MNNYIFYFMWAMLFFFIIKTIIEETKEFIKFDMFVHNRAFKIERMMEIDKTIYHIYLLFVFQIRIQYE